MGYIFCVVFGVAEFFLAYIYWKFRPSIDKKNEFFINVIGLIYTVILGGILLFSIWLADYFPGTDRGAAGIITIIPGAIGSWIFKRRYIKLRDQEGL